jgi:rifampicin phosphotransferase
MEYFRTIAVPPTVGAPPSEAAPRDPVSAALAKFFGPLALDPTSAEATTISGRPGAPGKVVGTARVLSSLADARKLSPHEVLVAATTAPPWTPLFATAAAVVSDTGGILSHCAVVAREYGIPAVVGTGNATTRIPDGHLVEVDGDAGVVHLLAPSR